MSFLQSKQRMAAIALIFAGIWGFGVTLVLGISLIGMVGNGTPANTILSMFGLGFAFLLIHFAYSGVLTWLGIRQLMGAAVPNRWILMLLLATVIMVGVSFLPGSTVGSIFFPTPILALVGLLVWFVTTSSERSLA